jgi:hypothetical protein
MVKIRVKVRVRGYFVEMLLTVTEHLLNIYKPSTWDCSDKVLPQHVHGCTDRQPTNLKTDSKTSQYLFCARAPASVVMSWYTLLRGYTQPGSPSLGAHTVNRCFSHIQKHTPSCLSLSVSLSVSLSLYRHTPLHTYTL